MEIEVKVSEDGLVDRFTGVVTFFLQNTESKRELPVTVDPYTTRAIVEAMQGIKSALPMAHDLFKNVISELGGEVIKVVIADLKEHTYYALIYLKNKTKPLDSRASDAIALALRFKCPIYVEEAVFLKHEAEMKAAKEALSEKPESGGPTQKQPEKLEEMDPEKMHKA